MNIEGDLMRRPIGSGFARCRQKAKKQNIGFCKKLNEEKNSNSTC